MTARIFLKLFVGVFCVLIVALTTVDYLASRVAERTYVETLRRDLTEKGHVLRHSIADLRSGYGNIVQELARAANARITLIDREGHVVVDSEADAASMGNHAARPEMSAALGGRVGSDTRRSATVGVNFLYVAVPVEGGALRLAVPLRDIDRQVNDITRQLLTSVALAFLPAVLVAAVFARIVSRKLAAIIAHAGNLARGKFDSRLSLPGRDEFATLAMQLNETGAKLEKTIAELEAEHQKLEQLERIRKDFVINVSHELRTPLASIQGYTETLLDGALHDPEHNIRFLSIIRQNAERLGRLIADLMTLSQIELRRTKFQFASYYINELITDSVDSVRPLAEKKNIAVAIEPAPDRTEVFCDSEAVHQILTNLLDNAVKYTPQNGRVTVSAVPAPDSVEVAVRDTGMGIPQDEVPRLFERFYRVDKARSRELGGTGLGLAIVKHLVKAQGGEIRVTSEVNVGSTFAFTLPVHDMGLLEYGSVQAEVANT